VLRIPIITNNKCIKSLLNLSRLLCILLLCSNGYSAESLDTAYEKNNELKAKPNKTIVRDPFTSSNKMYSESGAQAAPKESPAATNNNYNSSNTGQRLPKMRLKGILTKGINNSALLEIDGLGVFVVSRGEEIGLQAVGLEGTLKIIDVSANGIKVQSGAMGPVILVR
jgi:hypothetical protein